MALRPMAVPLEHWYVYYKLDARQLTAWLPHAARLMARVHAVTGVKGQLLQRADGARQADGISTLMEVYDGIADGQGFGRALEAAVAEAQAEVPSCAATARHTERFANVTAANA